MFGRGNGGRRRRGHGGGFSSALTGMSMTSYGQSHHNPVVGMMSNGFGDILSGGGRASHHSSQRRSRQSLQPQPQPRAIPSRLKCPYCQFRYCSAIELSDHLSANHVATPCHVADCAFTYRSQNEKQQHDQQAHQTMCPYCHIYVENSIYGAHLDSNHPIVKCELCIVQGLSYETHIEWELTRHHQINHQSCCTECSIPVWHSELKDHYLNQHQINISGCVHCEKVCSTAQEYVNHIMESHRFICGCARKCGRTFPTQALLTEHKKVMHPVCKTCKLQCYDRTALTDHQLADHPSCCVVM